MGLATPLLSAVGTRGALYTRVSTAEQAQGHSLQHQEDACKVFAEKLGISDVVVYSDAGFSAKSSNRPAFLQLLNDAEAGRFGTVIVLKLDRFARNRLDALLAKERLRKAGVKLYSVTEPLDDSPAGLITEGMIQLIAEWYTADLKQKVTSGLRKRAEKGLMNAMPPFGYIQSANPTADPPLVVPEEATIIRKAFELFATGTVSYRDIAAAWNAQGWRTRHRAPAGRPDDGPRLWSGDSVRKLIQSPIYMGRVPYKTEVLPGRHEAIVSEALWQEANRVGRRLNRGTATRYRQVHFYALAGILRCAECGSSLQGNHTESGGGWRYYRGACVRRGVKCTTKQRAVRADQIEAQVDEIVARFRAPKQLRERVIELLQQGNAEEDVEGQVRRLREKLRRLSRLYADLQVAEAEYEAERRKIEAEIDRLQTPVDKATEAVRDFDVLQLAWAKATPQEKRALGLALFDAISFDLNSMEIREVVITPAFRPWLVSE